MEWRQLDRNHQWAVTPRPGPARWAIGDERLGFDNPRFEGALLRDERGWGFAMPALRPKKLTVAIRKLEFLAGNTGDQRMNRRVSARPGPAIQKAWTLNSPT
jgi:hypothetical protein